MASESIIKLSGVSKTYKLFLTKTERMKEALHPFKKRYHKEFSALSDINLEVRKGEILGIVGMNGAGKSTLLKIISGIAQQSAGDVTVKGHIVPLLELGSGFNPEFSGIENIYYYNTVMGYSRKDTDKMLKKIIDFAEIGDFVNQPLKTYSSGMRARLAFAVAVNIDPDILILDEVLSVGDELFRRKSFAKIEDFFNAGKTILFVSHSAQNVNQLCTRAIMLHNGRIVLEGPPKFVTMNYQKFIFSPPDQRNKIISYIQGLPKDASESESFSFENDFTDNQAVKPSVNMPDTKKSGIKHHGAFYLDNFKPKSTVVTRNADIEVDSLQVQTIYGNQVNCIVANEEYLYTFNIRFNEDVGHISHGIGIKTTQGVVLTWRYYPDCSNFSKQFYRTGDVLTVKWKFICTFMPDTYFVGITIKRAGEEGPEIVYKGADIDVFQVIGPKGLDRGGFFDAGFQPEF